MTAATPLRVLLAMGNPDGRRHYRQTARARVWAMLGKLPFPVEVVSQLSRKFEVEITADDQVISREIFATGEWEPLELSFLRRVAQPGMVVFDVGANLGVHTLVLADCVGQQGHVHAFEPTVVFERLQRNIKRNGFAERVNLNRCAVSDTPGVMRFMACKPGAELFMSRGTPLDPNVTSGEMVEFPSTTLDLYAEEHRIDRIDLLKVDVEGAEDAVFAGARRLIAEGRIQRILFELSEPCLKNSNTSVGNVLDGLMANGFQIQLLDRKTGGLAELPSKWDGLTVNLVATLAR